MVRPAFLFMVVLIDGNNTDGCTLSSAEIYISIQSRYIYVYMFVCVPPKWRLSCFTVAELHHLLLLDPAQPTSYDVLIMALVDARRRA